MGMLKYAILKKESERQQFKIMNFAILYGGGVRVDPVYVERVREGMRRALSRIELERIPRDAFLP